MSIVTVNVSKTYEIHIGSGIMSGAADMVRAAIPAAKKLIIVSDDNVFSLYGEKVLGIYSEGGYEVCSFVFPHGEASKSLETYGQLLNKMCEEHLTKKDAVIALGGGVCGDLAGFAAGTYQRGISFVQMPTSLLAAVDSSVGGKTAVDLPAGKNQVGCFYQPDLVICDVDALSTLPIEEYRNGCAEIIKYAILDSEEFFELISARPVMEQYEDVITYCVNIKKRYVEEDERDNGIRMHLNLGHTIGHAVEACSEFGISHGQGVAIGMAAIAEAATKKGYLTSDIADKICELIKKYDLPREASFAKEDLMHAALLDKKNISGKIRLIVPKAIGNCETVPIDADEFIEWLVAFK